MFFHFFRFSPPLRHSVFPFSTPLPPRTFLPKSGFSYKFFSQGSGCGRPIPFLACLLSFFPCFSPFPSPSLMNRGTLFFCAPPDGIFPPPLNPFFSPNSWRALFTLLFFPWIPPSTVPQKIPQGGSSQLLDSSGRLFLSRPPFFSRRFCPFYPFFSFPYSDIRGVLHSPGLLHG